MFRNSRQGGGRLNPAPILSTDPECDRLRDEFRAAFAVYTREGAVMKDLLLSTASGDEAARIEAVHAQQIRLSEAQRRYEDARRSYVDYVLAETREL